MPEIRYRIEYSAKVVNEQLPKLPKTMLVRIVKAIHERLTVAPLDYGKPLTKEWKDYRRLRVGDYRVIYKVIEDKVVVFIVEVDHRKDIY